MHYINQRAHLKRSLKQNEESTVISLGVSMEHDGSCAAPEI